MELSRAGWLCGPNPALASLPTVEEWESQFLDSRRNVPAFFADELGLEDEARPPPFVVEEVADSDETRLLRLDVYELLRELEQ